MPRKDRFPYNLLHRRDPNEPPEVPGWVFWLVLVLVVGAVVYMSVRWGW